MNLADASGAADFIALQRIRGCCINDPLTLVFGYAKTLRIANELRQFRHAVQSARHMWRYTPMA